MERGLTNYKWEAKKKVLRIVVPIIAVIVFGIVSVAVKNYIADKTGYHTLRGDKLVVCNKCSGTRIYCKDVILGKKKNIFIDNELIEMYRCRDCNYKWVEQENKMGTVKGIMALFYSTSNDEINGESNELSYNDKHRMK